MRIPSTTHVRREEAPAPIKQQITRLSPHQNAKVMAVLLAVSTALFCIPFALFMMAFGPKGSGVAAVPFLLTAKTSQTTFANSSKRSSEAKCAREPCVYT